MAPLDPGRHWLAAGITGLARQREWDAVGTVEAPGQAGDEVEFVALADGRLLLTAGAALPDLSILASALEGSLDPPYRAVGVRRPDLWAVGACAIQVERLDPDPGGNELELTWDGATLALVSDGLPADASTARALERLAGGHETGPYAASARRLDADLWEVLVLPL